MIRLFYSIAAMNALFSSMAWCAAKPIGGRYWRS